LSQNVVHSDSDLILHNSSVLIDKEPLFFACVRKYTQAQSPFRKIGTVEPSSRIPSISILSDPTMKSTWV
ncbi:hypothetical protein EWI17_06155, partial [Enterococcus faecium]